MIKREIYNRIKNHLDEKEITLIIGPRQAGKTTIMKLLRDELDTLAKPSMYLNLDIDDDRPFFENQEDLIQKIKLTIGSEGYVFIDEIQKKENAGLFLKGLYDRDLPYKFVISGSGSVELKEKIHESLAGRKLLFEMTTVSFEEFANYRLDYKYTDSLIEYLSLHPAKSTSLLEEYLNFGGYPRVILAPTEEKKREIISEIYQSYLEKDIALLLNIKKTDKLTHLVRILAAQTGSLVNISDLSSTIGIAVETVNDYLYYLEKTYIIQKVTPFYRNVTKELTKMYTIYFVDLGLKNYSLGQFGHAIQSIPSNGFLFENFVYNNIKASTTNSLNSIHFWRTQDKAEVDFIIQTPNNLIPVEVKYKNLTSPQATRSFSSFISQYKPKKGYILHLGKAMTRDMADTKTLFLPYYDSLTIAKNLAK